jgi:hypothetical protein
MTMTSDQVVTDADVGVADAKTDQALKRLVGRSGAFWFTLCTVGVAIALTVLLVQALSDVEPVYQSQRAGILPLAAERAIVLSPSAATRTQQADVPAAPENSNKSAPPPNAPAMADAPSMAAPDQATRVAPKPLFGVWWLSLDGHLFLIALAAGGIGACVYTVSSFADYFGNRQLRVSWVWWLLLRVPLGIGLAVVVYLMLRGGLLFLYNTPTNLAAEAINPHGVAGLCALVGLFSRQAMDKLYELFCTLFRTAKELGRRDKLTHAKPEIDELEPARVKLGRKGRVFVRGSGFCDETRIWIGGEERPTVFHGEKELCFELTDEDVKTAGELSVVAYSPPPGGGASAAKALTVET